MDERLLTIRPARLPNLVRRAQRSFGTSPGANPGRVAISCGRAHSASPSLVSRVVNTATLRSETSPRTWVIAWALTLALHVLIVIGVQLQHRWAPAAPRPVTPAPIRLTFVGKPPASAEPRQPTMFTELPPDRADRPPEHADFLSTVTSRARDRAPGGDQSLPRMNGETDFPSVAMHAGRTEASPASPPPQPATPPTPNTAAKAATQPVTSGGAGAAVAPGPREATPPAPASGTIAHESKMAGTSDINQGEMDNPAGNAGLTGDVSLSTMAWDYAPWLQRFGRRLMRSWYPPPAYFMGLMKDGGWTVVELEITRTGDVTRMDVLEQHGHPSLILSATNALRAISPMEPLPADFPDKTLILRVRMIYPKVRSR